MNTLPTPVRARLARLRALSLVELLVVLVILGLVASVAVVGAGALSSRADVQRAETTAGEMLSGVDAARKSLNAATFTDAHVVAATSGVSAELVSAADQADQVVVAAAGDGTAAASAVPAPQADRCAYGYQPVDGERLLWDDTAPDDGCRVDEVFAEAPAQVAENAGHTVPETTDLTVSGPDVDVSWSPATFADGEDVADYEVHIDGKVEATVGGTETDAEATGSVIGDVLVTVVAVGEDGSRVPSRGELVELQPTALVGKATEACTATLTEDLRGQEVLPTGMDPAAADTLDGRAMSASATTTSDGRVLYTWIEDTGEIYQGWAPDVDTFLGGSDSLEDVEVTRDGLRDPGSRAEMRQTGGVSVYWLADTLYRITAETRDIDGDEGPIQGETILWESPSGTGEDWQQVTIMDADYGGADSDDVFGLTRAVGKPQVLPTGEVAIIAASYEWSGNLSSYMRVYPTWFVSRDDGRTWERGTRLTHGALSGSYVREASRNLALLEDGTVWSYHSGNWGGVGEYARYANAEDLPGTNFAYEPRDGDIDTPFYRSTFCVNDGRVWTFTEPFATNTSGPPRVKVTDDLTDPDAWELTDGRYARGQYPAVVELDGEYALLTGLKVTHLGSAE